MNEILILIALCILGSFCTVGIIDWMKAVRDIIVAAVSRKGKWSTLLWAVTSLGLSIGIGIAFGKTPASTIFASTWNAVAIGSALILSFNQLFGYRIVKIVSYWVDKVGYGASIPAGISDTLKRLEDKLNEAAPEPAPAVPETDPVSESTPESAAPPADTPADVSNTAVPSGAQT